MSDEARASTLDETLRAIVTADRLALTKALEAKDFLHRRLSVFYGYFALLAALAAIAGGARTVLVDVEPRVRGLVLELQIAHAALLCMTYAGLHYWARAAGWVRALDLVATVATAATAALALSVVPRVLTVDVSAVSFFILFFALRAALVPSKPWLATLVAAVCAMPFSLGLYNLYRHAHVPDPEQATSAALRAMLCGISGVYVVSKTIYGLRRVAERAVQLGQYVIQEKIGEGGMGTVYRASHALLKRPTAIKLISPERASETATARFEREVLAASRLSHPNTVAIYDFGRTRGGVFYYAMELLDGQDLSRLVEHEGPQPAARTVHILRQVSAALGEAHETGLVHRDVKPANIMLCTRGGVQDFVKVLDFGLVKDLATPDTTKITVEGAIAGTPLFMAPEAFLDPDSVGPPADVYAVGCVAYFLLTGRPPFVGTNFVEVCIKHAQTAPAPPSKRAPGAVPVELDTLVLRCLDKDPLQRPTTRALGESLARMRFDTARPSDVERPTPTA